MPERLHKILARHGIGSRREIERWIAEGRVTVNRKLAQVGDQYNEGDRVAVDGKEVTARLSIDVPTQVIMFHKTQGQPIEAGASDRDGDSDKADAPPDTTETVLDKLPALRGSRWIPINPMHPGDSGLLLLTNDGNLGYALTRRKRWIPTAYMVRVLAPDAETPPVVPPNVSYDNGRSTEHVEFTSVEPAGGEGANLWYRVELPRADRRAALRALFESRDLKVSRMTQVAFGNIELPRDLPRMRHKPLSAEQIAALYALAQIPPPQPPAPATERKQSASHKSVRGKTGNKRRGPAPDRRSPPRKQSQRKAPHR